jgi:hypothetical protein
MTELDNALADIAQVRHYTTALINTIDPADWFRMPAGGVTHVAWQVGHIAMAQYRLCLERVRGVRPEDEALISSEFLKQFGRDSVPDPDPAKYPTPAEILAVYHRVHDQLRREATSFAEIDLAGPIHPPHRICKTKLDCLFWSSKHEMLHAGQIGLLRRLLGAAPLW